MATIPKLAPWKVGITEKRYPKLSESIEADVVIIGGGLTGILCAYFLSKAGKKVVVLEKGELGSGATHLTTAELSESIDIHFTELVSSFDLKDAKALVKAHRDAIRHIEEIIATESIKADFKRVPNYLYANMERDVDGLRKEYAAARKLGVEASLETNGSALGIRNAGYIKITDQALFQPMKFLHGLAHAARKHGARIFEHTEAKSLIVSSENEAKRVTVSTGRYAVMAPWAITATYEPFHEPLRLYFKKGMYITYVFQLEVTGMRLAEGLYEDSSNPYHYLRIEKERGKKEIYRVIAGGEDHRQDFHTDEVKSFNALKDYVDSIIPPENYRITYRWKGPILEPLDGFPLIGAMNTDPVLYASAFSGNGMTYAPIAARLMSDRILGTKPTRLDELYSPKRIPHVKALMEKAVDYASEAFGGAVRNTFTKSKTPDRKIVSKAVDITNTV